MAGSGLVQKNPETDTCGCLPPSLHEDLQMHRVYRGLNNLSLKGTNNVCIESTQNPRFLSA